MILTKMGSVVMSALAAFGLMTPTAGATTARHLYASYVSAQGVHFYSYTPKWTKAKLQQLNTAFMQNAHGAELKDLTAINLYPDHRAGEAGLCHMTYTTGRYAKFMPGATIDLFYADVVTNPNDISPVLSHEYGHLFTTYWLLTKEHKLPTDATTGWAKIRGLKGLPVRYSNSHLKYNHFWQPEEIMADDYYYLFGSEAGKQTLKAPAGTTQANFYAGMMENIAVPAPETVPGLKQYWEKLSGIKVNNGDALVAPTLTGVDVTSEPGVPQPVYDLHFTAATKDSNVHIKYFAQISTQDRPAGSRIVNDGPNVEDALEVHMGGVDPDTGYYMVNPKGKAFFRIFALDEKTNQLTWSPMYWYDFSDQSNPKPLSNQFNFKA